VVFSIRGLQGQKFSAVAAKGLLRTPLLGHAFHYCNDLI
jgi:hypothetical protein